MSAPSRRRCAILTMKRIDGIATRLSSAFDVEAEIHRVSGAPAVVNDAAMTSFAREVAVNLFAAGKDVRSTGSDQDGAFKVGDQGRRFHRRVNSAPSATSQFQWQQRWPG